MRYPAKSRPISQGFRRLFYLLAIVSLIWFLYVVLLISALNKKFSEGGKVGVLKDNLQILFYQNVDKMEENPNRVQRDPKNGHRQRNGSESRSFIVQSENGNPKEKEDGHSLNSARLRSEYTAKLQQLERENGVTFPQFIPWNPPDAPGEGGLAFNIAHRDTASEDLKLYHEGMRTYAYNSWLSDKISVRRRLPDPGPPECRPQQTSANFAPVSVVVCFYNDAWSVLLRTVHSILERTPAHLLAELILVDDASTLEHLKRPLEVYLNAMSKVKLVRMQRREGLIRARLLGYQMASASTLVFLDSHIECFPGWLQPLLKRIDEDKKVVVFPVIEVIDSETLHVRVKHNVTSYGVFRWTDMTFQWGTIPRRVKSRLRSLAEPIRSPTMPGGLFAIDKDWFAKLGTYDPEMKFWGGENIELSFKAWMCNGSVELVPCSHVGHIFRSFNPATWTEHDVSFKNSLRVAEVWTDEFKNLLYERFNFQLPSFGNVSARQQLRMRLKCKDFQWYRKYVYPEMDCPAAKYAGQVRNRRYAACLDSMAKTETPGLHPCHNLGGYQFWLLTQEGKLRQGPLVLCALGSSLSLQTRQCRAGSTGLWTLTKVRQLQLRNTETCLQAGLERKTLTLTLQPCRKVKEQIWMLQLRRWRLPPL